MSAFLQSRNVRFAGRPPSRPFRYGRPFHRGHAMPKGNLAGRRTEAPPYSFLQ